MEGEMTKQDFESACAALPEGVFWGDPLTPEIARGIMATPSKTDDDAITRALVTWFSPDHPDQSDFASRMRKAISAANKANEGAR
jgi:hypothetical protein